MEAVNKDGHVLNHGIEFNNLMATTWQQLVIVVNSIASELHKTAVQLYIQIIVGIIYIYNSCDVCNYACMPTAPRG